MGKSEIVSIVVRSELQPSKSELTNRLEKLRGIDCKAHCDDPWVETANETIYPLYNRRTYLEEKTLLGASLRGRLISLRDKDSADFWSVFQWNGSLNTEDVDLSRAQMLTKDNWEPQDIVDVLVYYSEWEEKRDKNYYEKILKYAPYYQSHDFKLSFTFDLLCTPSNDNYFGNRGLSEAIQKKYLLGCHPEGMNHIIKKHSSILSDTPNIYNCAYRYFFPVIDVDGDITYFLSRIDEKAEVPAGMNIRNKYRNLTGKEIRLYNDRYLLDSNLAGDLIFICEGIFDSLSFEEIGYNAIALNSTNNTSKLKQLIEEQLGKSPLLYKGKTFVVCADNDDAGNKAKNALSEFFAEKRLSFDVMGIPRKYKDVNEFLIADRNGFKNRVQSLINTMGTPDVVSRYLDDFFDQLQKNRLLKPIDTGFPALNNSLGGGLFPGLYVLGAVSSLGKTTFVLQMADYIALSEHDVLFFSLEMSKFEMVAKSLSMLTGQIARESNGLVASSLRDIMQGRANESTLKSAYDRYRSRAEHISIIEGNFETTVKTMATRIYEHMKNRSKPVVFVDYLQIITPESDRLSDKQAVDRNVTQLKQLSREFDIPIVLVSSFNRENYITPVSYSSFKESGAIEFGADVIIGLQLEAIHIAQEQKNLSEKHRILDEGKKETPRKIELVILKNRNGVPWSRIRLNYYAEFNYFEEREKAFENTRLVEEPPIKLDRESYVFITSADHLRAYTDTLTNSPVLAVDTETTGLNPFSSEVRLIQFALDNSPVLVVDIPKVGEEGKQLLQGVLGGSQLKIFHNAKFDVKVLQASGLPVKGKVFDTMIASKLLFAGEKDRSHSLQAVVKQFIGQDLPKEEQLSDWTGDLTPEQLEYASRDASILLKLHTVLDEAIQKAELSEVAKLEFDCIFAVVNMELNGWKVDKDHLEVISHELTAVKEQLAPTLQAELGDINFNSPKQLMEALHSKGVKVKSTGERVLTPLAGKHPFIKSLLDYKKIEKQITSFTTKWPEHIEPTTGRIHADYHQLGADTGRFSCSNPNLQQIPRGDMFRRCFIASEGCKLVVADYSQIELRVLAEITDDERMIEAYKNGEDLHTLTARIITQEGAVSPEERRLAKAINFGMVFGIGDTGLSEYAKTTYNVDMTVEEAKRFKERFFEAYQGVQAWQKEQDKIRFNPDMYEVRTLSGRRRRWHERPSSSALYNTPIQGTAADITKKALVLLNERLDHDIRLVGCVHDEICLESINLRMDEASNLLVSSMEEAGAYFLKKVPVKADLKGVMETWAGE